MQAMFTAQNAYRISAVAGLLVFSLAVLSATTEPAPVCGELAANYAPIIAFEMARSVTDLHAIFGAAAGECRTSIVAQMDMINWIDVFAYIPIYGSFLVFFFLGIRERGARPAAIGLGSTVTACLADYAENICLFNLSANPDVASIWLAILPWVTETKWVGLGISGAIGGYLLASRGGAWRLTFMPCMLGLVAALATIPMPAGAGPYLSLAFAVGWIVFLTVVARESLRRTAATKLV
jgi:hypothetical protein